MTEPTTHELNNDVTIKATFTGSPALSTVKLYVRSPASADPTVYSNTEIADLGGGTFSKVVVADVPGSWFWTFAVEGTAQAAIDGAFVVDPSQAREKGAVDANDLRTLIPRVRRAVEGVTSDSPLTSDLTDDQVLASVADALADVILYTGSAFGHELQVVERDAYYLAPTEWRLDKPLTPQEETVIASQATLNHFFFEFQSRKTMEQIQDEAQTWQVEYSPNVLRDALKVLVDARDRALEALEGTVARLVAYESFLAVRDAQVSQQVESWVREGASSWGGQERDYRFGMVG